MGKFNEPNFEKFPIGSNIGMLYIILSVSLSRLRILRALKFFPLSIKLFDFKMANFLTKIIRKSGIRRKVFFFKTAKPFFIPLY